MKKLYSILVGVTALALVACSLKLKVTLFNNSGIDISVRPDRDEIALIMGQSATFYYPEEPQRWEFKLSTSQCEYVYQVPRSLKHYPWVAGARNILKTQVEPDFSIYLLPPGANSVGAIGEYASLQQDGFPLRPISSSCKK